MKTKNEPAFPAKVDVGMGYANAPGMSLRDYFAAQAMAAMAARLMHGELQDMADGIRGGAIVSRAAYVMADAMLAERAK